MSQITTVMIVDDDADDVEFFCEAVAEFDSAIRCISAENGLEALKMLKNPFYPRPDFIFLDLNMPRMGGKQCLTEIKNDQDLNQIPVVIYSTSKLEEDFLETQMMGAILFITKPTRLKKLAEVIGLVLSGRLKPI